MQLPARHSAKTCGLIYDLRQTAGVLRRPTATYRTTPTMQASKPRSPPRCGSGTLLITANACKLASQVQKSLALNGAPIAAAR